MDKITNIQNEITLEVFHKILENLSFQNKLIVQYCDILYSAPMHFLKLFPVDL
jgi:Cdc6-like AAA superfamily ATPase